MKRYRTTIAFICWAILLSGVCTRRALGADLELRFESQDQILRRDVTAVCQDVVRVVQKRISRPPALGVKPIVIRNAPDDAPRALINGLPGAYFINLTCLDSRDYCRITYQFGHELGHVYVDPRKDNWFIESVATAVSLIALSGMHDKWSHDAPFQNWGSWAHNFLEYPQRHGGRPVECTGLGLVRSYVEGVAAIESTKRLAERPEQHACALIIASVLDKHPRSLGAITSLGTATSPEGARISEGGNHSWPRPTDPS